MYHRAGLIIALCLIAAPARSETVVFQFDTPIGTTCTKAQESMDVQAEIARGYQSSGGKAMKSVCLCKQDSAGNCLKDTNGNEMWWATIQLVK